MNGLLGKSGRAYQPLPIDATRGFPQSFPFLFGGRTYRISLYADVAARLLGDQTAMIELPAPEAFLVVRVASEQSDGTRQTVFLRKVVPALEYETEKIALIFPQQRIA